MRDRAEILEVTDLGIIRILGSLRIEEIESTLDEIRNSEKLIMNEDGLPTQIAE